MVGPPVREIIHSLKLVDYLLIRRTNKLLFSLTMEANSICSRPLEELFGSVEILAVMNKSQRLTFTAVFILKQSSHLLRNYYLRMAYMLAGG